MISIKDRLFLLKKIAKETNLDLSSNFFVRFKEMCDRVHIKPEDLLLVMVSESGLNPSIQNPGKGPEDKDRATGLIQFIGGTLRDQGWKGTQDDFKKLSGEEQLPYIERYINSFKTIFRSAEQYYVANYYPKALSFQGIKNGDSNAVITQKSDGHVYTDNIGLDTDKDGKITLGDLKKHLDSLRGDPRYLKALEMLKTSTNYIAEEKPKSQEYDSQSNSSSSTQADQNLPKTSNVTPESSMDLSSLFSEITGAAKLIFDQLEKKPSQSNPSITSDISLSTSPTTLSSQSRPFTTSVTPPSTVPAITAPPSNSTSIPIEEQVSDIEGQLY